MYQDHNMFDKADQEVDEWRAQEIANDIAQHKVIESQSLIYCAFFY